MAPSALGLGQQQTLATNIPDGGKLHATTINKRRQRPAVVLSLPPKVKAFGGFSERSLGNAQSVSHAATAILVLRSGSEAGVLHLQARCCLVAQKAWSGRAGEAPGMWRWIRPQ